MQQKFYLTEGCSTDDTVEITENDIYSNIEDDENNGWTADVQTVMNLLQNCQQYYLITTWKLAECYMNVNTNIYETLVFWNVIVFLDSWLQPNNSQK